MTPVVSTHYRRASLAAVLLVAAGLLSSALGPLSPMSSNLYAQESAATKEAPEKSAEAAGGEEHDAGWNSTIAKTVNFAALVGILVYFLGAPISGYLRGRGETIRKDLVDAAALRTEAEQQLAGVRARLAGLPAEIDAMRRRGQDELAAERVRLAEATAKEKTRVLDLTQREIDAQFRAARRTLTEHAAELAMSLARARVERDITPEDQTRLIDRYASEVRA